MSLEVNFETLALKASDNNNLPINQNEIIKKENNETNTNIATINEDEEDTKNEDQDIIMTDPPVKTNITNSEPQKTNENKLIGKKRKLEEIIDTNGIIVNIKNATMRKHEGSYYVIAQVSNNINNIESAIFFDKNVTPIIIKDKRVKFDNYQINNDVYYVYGYSIIGKITKKVKLNNNNNKNAYNTKMVRALNKKQNASNSNNKKTKTKRKMVSKEFCGHLIGVGPRYNLKRGPGYRKHFFFINTEGIRYKFTAFSKEYNKFAARLKPGYCYNIKSFKTREDYDNEYSFTTFTKIEKASPKLTPKREVFNFFKIINIDQLLNKNININKTYDIIGKIVNINNNENSGLKEIFINDGSSIQVNFWRENMKYYANYLHTNENIILMGCRVKTNKQINYINSFELLIPLNKYKNIKNNKIKDIGKINVDDINKSITKMSRIIVDENGYYDQFRRVANIQIININWDEIRTKKLANTNIIVYNKRGDQDKSLACVSVGSIYNISDIGKIDMIYPVPIVDGEKLYKKAIWNDGQWEYYAEDKSIQIANTIGLRYGCTIKVSDYTASIDVRAWDNAFLLLLKINNISLTAEDYFKELVKGTKYEGIAIDKCNFQDEELFSNLESKSLKHKLGKLKSNWYTFGLTLNPPNNYNSSPTYKLQSVGLTNIIDDINYTTSLIKHLNTTSLIKDLSD